MAKLLDQLESGDLMLPKIPVTVKKIMDVVEDPESTLKDLASAVETDPVCAGYILKVANSPLFYCANKVARIDAAVSRLGTDVIMNLVLCHFAAGLATNAAGLAAWKRSLQAGAWAMAVGKHNRLDST